MLTLSGAGQPQNIGGDPKKQSFIDSFGEPESAYSLRNLTSDLGKYVVQVSDGKLVSDLTEQQVKDLVFSKQETLRVVKWYDQAGTNQDLVADFISAPYLIKDGFLQLVNEKPTLTFLSNCVLRNIQKSKELPDPLRAYLTANFNALQEVGEFGNNIISDILKEPRALLQWKNFNSLFSNNYFSITQNNLLPTVRNKQNLFQFESDYTQLALYNITDGLVTPYNFFLGDNTEMAISEFILYPNESSNVEGVTENIINNYNIINKPVKPGEPELPGEGEFPGGIKLPKK